MLDKDDIVKLLEAQEQVFATKKDLHEIKEDIVEFKSEILTGQDEILKELKALRQEKTMSEAQDKRKTKVLKIHNDALKNNKILSDKQVSEIETLGAF